MINSQRPSALIVLEDKCPDCSDLAGIMSHGSNPIFSLDVGSFESGSRAFKMYPSPEDMSEFFIDVLGYFKWRAFNLVVDSGDGNLKIMLLILVCINTIHVNRLPKHRMQINKYYNVA